MKCWGIYNVIGLADSKSYKILSIEIDEDRLYSFGEIDSFLVTKVADRHFVSFPAEYGYQFLNYKLANDSIIKLFQLNEEFLKREVSRNKLKAEFYPGSIIIFKQRVDASSLIITSTTEQLRDYFSNVDLDSAFNYSGSLIKVVE